MVLDVDVDGSGEIDFEVIASAGAAGKLLDEHIFVFGSVCVLLTLLKSRHAYVTFSTSSCSIYP